MICSTKHSFLKEIGKARLLQLNTKKLFIIGAGGLGCPLLLYLSRFKLKQITLVDYDIIDESNLERQILFDKKDVGKEKAKVVADKINQFTKTKYYVEPIENINKNKKMLSNLIESDIIIDCTDSPCTKKFIFELCIKHNKPLVYGSVVGTKGYACLISQLTKNKKKNKKIDKIRNILYAKQHDKASKLGVYSIAVNAIANIQANLTIRFLLKKQIKDKIFFFDAWTIDLKELKI